MVTGASRGIDAAASRLLAQSGWAVGVNYARDEAAATSVAEDIVACGGEALVVRADVTDATQRRVDDWPDRTAAWRDRHLGLQCGGNLGSGVRTVARREPRSNRGYGAGTTAGRAYPARAVLPGMVARGRGSVVVVASELARCPEAGFSALSMAKGAIEAAARAMAEEFGARGVRVNTIAPWSPLTDAAAWASAEVRSGWSNLTPLHRNALAEDVAGPIAFLAGDTARFVTGAHLPTDGGVVMA